MGAEVQEEVPQGIAILDIDRTSDLSTLERRFWCPIHVPGAVSACTWACLASLRKPKNVDQEEESRDLLPRCSPVMARMSTRRRSLEICSLGVVTLMARMPTRRRSLEIFSLGVVTLMAKFLVSHSHGHLCLEQ